MASNLEIPFYRGKPMLEDRWGGLYHNPTEYRKNFTWEDTVRLTGYIRSGHTVQFVVQSEKFGEVPMFISDLVAYLTSGGSIDEGVLTAGEYTFVKKGQPIAIAPVFVKA